MCVFKNRSEVLFFLNLRLPGCTLVVFVCVAVRRIFRSICLPRRPDFIPPIFLVFEDDVAYNIWAKASRVGDKIRYTSVSCVWVQPSVSGDAAVASYFYPCMALNREFLYNGCSETTFFYFLHINIYKKWNSDNGYHFKYILWHHPNLILI